MATDPHYHVLIILETSREYGRGLLRGISQFSREHTHWIIERPPFFYQVDNSITDDFNLVANGRIDGIIMRDINIDLPESMRRLPIVYASYRDDKITDKGVRIFTDDRKIAGEVFNHFYERGIQNLAFLGYMGMFWSKSRESAFGKIADTHGLTVSCLELETNFRDIHEIHSTIGNWLNTLNKPVGLMVCNDDCGQLALTACRESGLQVPQDVSIVGIDNDEFVCGLSHPPLSSIALNLEVAGYEAARCLDALMAGKSLNEPVIWIKPTYVVIRPSSDLMAVKDATIIEAVKYVYDNIDKPIQVNDLQRELAIARRVLYSKFKQNLGCSVHQFIKKVRVDKIKVLLRETDLTINQIAQKMGFPGADHFAKYFRSIQGENPAQYRQNHRRD